MINRYIPFGKTLCGVLPFLIVWAVACAPRLNKTASLFQKVCVRYQLPKVALDGSMEVIRDSFYMSYYEDYVICQSPVKVFHENDTAIIDSSIRYQCFVFKKGNEYGKWFDSVGDPKYMKCKVDSILKKKAFGGIKLFDPHNFTLVEHRVDRIHRGSIQTYVPLFTPDEFYGDTCKLFTVPPQLASAYTMVPMYDTIHKDKVWRAEIRFRQTFSARYNIMLPPRAFIFEAINLSQFNTHELMKLIHMYENDEYEEYNGIF